MSPTPKFLFDFTLKGLKDPFWATRCHTEGFKVTEVTLSRIIPFITCDIPIREYIYVKQIIGRLKLA